MRPPKKLARVLSDEVHGAFHLAFETEDGEVFRVRASEQQITDLIQELEDLLDDDAEDEDAVTERKEMGDE